ncbi:hypothetical protein AK830_g3356 [Neonectria ditissima]|uniref:Kinesin light chain n=1 Tax=Neonectria ditissima TaxID=78410 RepID=A0A0P7AZN1_9HYPO|nr:hypothetical protein AK830_g3356 [Neonectria ditissima]
MVETQWEDPRRLSTLRISEKSPEDTTTTEDQDQDEEANVSCMAPDPSLANTEPSLFPTTQSQTPEIGTASAASPLQDAYSYSAPVPKSKTKKRVYTRAPVLAGNWTVLEYEERFLFVKDELQKLCMVGTTPADAVPSIVIIWDNEKGMKSLRSLFRSGAQHMLLCGGQGSLTNWFSKSPTSHIHIPQLKLVYFLHERGSIFRMALLQLQMQAFFDNDSTYCGGIVRYQGCLATLGVAIQIDDVSAYLTVNHIFPPVSPDSKSPIIKPRSPTGNPSPPSVTLHTTAYSDDDEEYESESNSEDESKGQDHDIKSATPPESSHSHKGDWEALPPPLDLDLTLPYLDWSLTRPVSPSLNISYANLFFLNGQDTDPSVLDTIRDKPRHHLALVKLVSGIRGPLSGRILAGSSFIQSLPGQKDCEVFTVLLDTPGGLFWCAPGTLGCEVYGHVVGSDPFGYALVVPLEHVLSQVRTSFKASHVGLSPSSLRQTSDDMKVSLVTESGTPQEILAVATDYDDGIKHSPAMPLRSTEPIPAEQAQRPQSPPLQEPLDQKTPAKPATVNEHATTTDLARMNSLAESHDREGKYGMAVQTYSEILAIQEETLGNQSQGQYAEAEKILVPLCELQSTLLDVPDATRLAVMNNLAVVLNCQGKYRRAEIMQEQTLDLQRRVLGEDDPDTLTSMNNLTLVLENQEKYDQAEQMGRRTLSLRERILGPEHPDTLTSMSNLADVLGSQEKYDDAEDVGRRTLALRAKVLGPEHPETMVSMNNLAVVLEGKYEFDEAETLLRQTVALRGRHLGETHPETITSRLNLENVLEGRSRKRTLDKLRQIAAIHVERLGRGSVSSKK